MTPEQAARECFDCALADGLRPDPIMTVSEWADTHRVLAPEASAEPGRWRTDRTPYLRDIMDALSSKSPVELVAFVKSAQVGGTEAGINWIGAIIDNAPASTMAVYPTVDTGKRWSKQRLDPAIQMTPRLREKVPPAKKKDPDNTTMTKVFPGGFLAITGANSAVGLRSMPVKNLFLDEVDGYPDDVDGEGEPVKLAIARTRTFARRKIFMCSTPTIGGRSRIESAFLQTGQRRYHVPCPHCGVFDHLRWHNLKWEPGQPETAQYLCEHCGCLIDEREKTVMLAAGKWVPDHPELEDGKRAGFHINSLYSPLGWYSWVDMAREWEEAQKDQRKLRTFVNTVLGETWNEKGEAPEWRRLYDRREAYALNVVPAKALLLTGAVDVQKDRLEVEIKAWGPNKENWSIDYRVIPGDTATAAPWAVLDALVSESWPHELGGNLMLRFLGVDSGYNTTEVYAWVRKHSPQRVVATKGFDNLQMVIGQPKRAEVNRAGKAVKYGIRVWPIGTNLAKGELYGWLRQDLPLDGSAPPVGYVHLPQYGEEYFQMLTAEELKKTTVRGFTRYAWQKIRDRNEALDLHVINRAMAALAGIDRWRDADWNRMREAVSVKAAVDGRVSDTPRVMTPTDTEMPRKKSSFWSR